MAIKLKNGLYKCPFCDFTANDFVTVNIHRDSDHVYVLIPMEVSDLNKLIQFIYTRSDGLITQKIIDLLRRYLRPENQISKLKESDNNTQES